MRIIICLSLASLLLCCCNQAVAQIAARESKVGGPPQHLMTSANQTRGITKQMAVLIANDDARRRFTPLSRFRIIPCEQFRFWRIIYDGGGPEYVIDKLSGRIIRKQAIPQAPVGKSRKVTPLANTSLRKEQAIKIAKADAESKYGSKGEDVSRFGVIACEQNKVWRIIFDLKKQSSSLPLSNASYPKYVIDKKTGEIIYRELN